MATTYLNTTYTITDGTSFAAPHVVGAAALLKSKSPQLPPLVIHELLSARDEQTPMPGDPDGVHDAHLTVKGR